MQHVTGETPWHVRGNFDYGWDLPLRNSSLWLRTAAGYVERQSGHFDLELLSSAASATTTSTAARSSATASGTRIPGFGIDEISGQSFVRPMLEWNITPYVFESVGTPAFHLAWLRPAVFASALWTDVESSSRRKNYANVGAQVDLRLHRRCTGTR